MKPTGGLPAQLTSFIGREPTIETARRRLAQARLVTLVGPGGCGKTRLAIEVARRRTYAGKGHAFFVDLSGLYDPVLVPDAVSRTLGLPEVPGKDVAAHVPTCPVVLWRLCASLGRPSLEPTAARSIRP